jgi:hypothetical protein
LPLNQFSRIFKDFQGFSRILRDFDRFSMDYRRIFWMPRMPSAIQFRFPVAFKQHHDMLRGCISSLSLSVKALLDAKSDLPRHGKLWVPSSLKHPEAPRKLWGDNLQKKREGSLSSLRLVFLHEWLDKHPSMQVFLVWNGRNTRCQVVLTTWWVLFLNWLLTLFDTPKIDGFIELGPQVGPWVGFWKPGMWLSSSSPL